MLPKIHAGETKEPQADAAGVTQDSGDACWVTVGGAETELCPAPAAPRGQHGTGTAGHDEMGCKSWAGCTPQFPALAKGFGRSFCAAVLGTSCAADSCFLPNTQVL